MSTKDQKQGALSVTLEVWMSTATMRRERQGPQRLSVSDTRHMYWTPAQLVAHHTSGGCDLRPSDLLGTGTISGAERAVAGSMLEATLGGKEPITIGSGEQRQFLEDGDEVILKARAIRDGYATIGFGDCRGIVSSNAG